MSSQNFILNYVQSCASGKLAVSDCGPIWQMAVIAVFLLVAVTALLVVRFRSRTEAEKA